MRSMIKVYLCLSVLLLLQPDPGEGRGGVGGGVGRGGSGGGPLSTVFSVIGGIALAIFIFICCCCCLQGVLEPDSVAGSVHGSRKGSQSDDMKLEEVTTEDSTKHTDDDKTENVENETDPMLSNAGTFTHPSAPTYIPPTEAQDSYSYQPPETMASYQQPIPSTDSSTDPKLQPGSAFTYSSGLSTSEIQLGSQVQGYQGMSSTADWTSQTADPASQDFPDLPPPAYEDVN